MRVHVDLGAKRSLGVHWGTFALSDEALDAPPRALASARKAVGLPDSAFFVMALGETRQLPRAGRSTMSARAEPAPPHSLQRAA